MKTNYPILDFLKVKYHTKRKRKKNHSTVHTLNTNYYLNIYNPLKNIQFTKEKKKWKKKLPSTWFLENKVLYKKNIKINHFTIHILNTNYYLKYL